MISFIVNAAISVAVITLATWLAKRFPNAAGFVTSLPLTTMLVLALSRNEQGDAFESTKFARSLLVSIPLSSSFLVPFAVAPRFGLGFWTCFASGLALLAAGYGVHRLIFGA